MRALIVAGGKGTRVAGISEEIPKALFPVNGRPVAEHQVELLLQHGITDFVFCLGHLGDAIRDALGDGSRWNTRIEYVEESEPLGTGGPIRLAAGQFDCGADFLVLFGDIMLEMDVAKLIQFHAATGALMTFAVHQSDHPEDSSNVKMEQSGRITSVGRPEHGHPLTGITRTSIQMLNPRVLDFIPAGKVSLEDDVVPALLEAGEPVFGYYTDEFIKDMGTPERYKQVGGDLTEG